MKNPLFHWLLVAIWLVGLLSGCTAIKVETGTSEQERLDSKNDEASRLRREWGNRIDTATPQMRPHVLIDLIRSLVAAYDRLGLQIGDEWEKGNRGRGTEIPADEMRSVVEASLARDNPILSAWEDNLEYGLGRVRDDRFLASAQEKSVVELVDHFYAHASAVRYPSGSLIDYREKLSQSSRVIVEEMDQLQRVLPGQ